MKIVVACDSFKGCLSSSEAGDAAALGIRSSRPDADVVVIPVGDGGEGTMAAIAAASGACAVSCRASGPLGQPLTAEYFITPSNTALIETASASGLGLVNMEDRNPLVTTTCGTGELISDALARGCRDFIIGFGGSATCDGGAGLLAALGARFFDEDGCEFTPCGGESLIRIKSIDLSRFNEKVAGARFTLALDVSNILCGPTGAAAVFAPQKGADAASVTILERALEHWSAITGAKAARTPGAGAAGGAASAFMAFTQCVPRRGIDLVLGFSHFDDKIRGASLIITGEGRVDRQTLMGKAPYGILKASRDIPVVVIGGEVDDRELLLAAGFAEALAIAPGSEPLSERLDPTNARINIVRTVSSYITANVN